MSVCKVKAKWNLQKDDSDEAILNFYSCVSHKKKKPNQVDMRNILNYLTKKKKLDLLNNLE